MLRLKSVRTKRNPRYFYQDSLTETSTEQVTEFFSVRQFWQFMQYCVKYLHLIIVQIEEMLKFDKSQKAQMLESRIMNLHGNFWPHNNKVYILLKIIH